MRNWRRTSTSGAAAAPAAAPLVLSVSATTPSADYLVSFNQPVTWDGVGSGTMRTSFLPATWAAQVSPSQISIATTGVPLIGEPWDWSGPDASLSPVPNPAQSGVTVA